MGWPRIKFEDNEMTTEIKKVNARLDAVEKEQVIFNVKHEKCESDHQDNHDYRRKTDSKLDGIYTVATEMLTIMKSYKEYEPSIIRAKNNFVAIDTIYKWAAWLTTVSAGLYVILDLKGII